MYLPEKFERKMQDILGDEYQQIANESIQNQMKENSEIYWDDFEGIQEDTPLLWAACEYEEDISGGLCPDLSI